MTEEARELAEKIADRIYALTTRSGRAAQPETMAAIIEGEISAFAASAVARERERSEEMRKLLTNCLNFGDLATFGNEVRRFFEREVKS